MTVRARREVAFVGIFVLHTGQLEFTPWWWDLKSKIFILKQHSEKQSSSEPDSRTCKCSVHVDK